MNYSSEVLQRFGLPHGAGQLSGETAGVVCGEAEDRSLGIWVRFEVQVLEGSIRAARFQLFGCPHAIAAAGLIAEWLEGKRARSLTRLDMRGVARTLDVPVEKFGKLLKIEDALLACWRGLSDASETKDS